MLNNKADPMIPSMTTEKCRFMVRCASTVSPPGSKIRESTCGFARPGQEYFFKSEGSIVLSCKGSGWRTVERYEPYWTTKLSAFWLRVTHRRIIVIILRYLFKAKYRKDLNLHGVGQWIELFTFFFFVLKRALKTFYKNSFKRFRETRILRYLYLIHGMLEKERTNLVFYYNTELSKFISFWLVVLLVVLRRANSSTAMSSKFCKWEHSLMAARFAVVIKRVEN